MERLNRPPLGREVTRILRRMIVEGEIRPGERLVEDRLAQAIGASRTPLREALHRLEQEGVLKRRDHGGYELPRLTPTEVEEAVETRALLESYAASLAARRATPELLASMQDCMDAFAQALERADHKQMVLSNAQFHLLLGQAAGSKLLSRLLEELEALVERISVTSPDGQEAGTWSAPEHDRILSALKARDPEAAAAAAGEHVRRGGRWLLERLARGEERNSETRRNP